MKVAQHRFGTLAAAFAVAVGVLLAIGAWLWFSPSQACPKPSPRDGLLLCSPIPRGPHPADGLSEHAVTVVEVSRLVDGLPEYPGSVSPIHEDSLAESEASVNGLLGYFAAQASLKRAVYARPAALLLWYHDQMLRRGWQALPVTYGAPQLTVRDFKKGVRLRASLYVDSADYAAARIVVYHLVVTVAPFVCNGAMGCGASEFGGSLGT